MAVTMHTPNRNAVYTFLKQSTGHELKMNRYNLPVHSPAKFEVRNLSL